MKSKILIYSILCTIIGFVILSIFSSGENHVIVVQENEVLQTENSSLKKENSSLKTLNSQLVLKNNKLESEKKILQNDFKNLELKTNSEKNAILPKIIIKIEKDIYSGLGWVDVDMAIDLLNEKLNRKPNREELAETLEDLYFRDLLYFKGNPDPYLKGKKYTKKDMDKFLNNYK